MVFEVFGANVQARLSSRQLHELSLGVGGSVDEARKVEFVVGHEGKVVVPGALGVFGPVVLLNCACRRVKSSETVTVVLSEEMVTMPNWPWELVAGK